MMCGNVVHNKFWTHENYIAIWNKKVHTAAWGFELTELTIVNTQRDHWLPRVLQQFFDLHEDI